MDVKMNYNLATLTVAPYVQYIKNYIYNAPELTEQGDVVVRQTINGGFPSFVYDQVDASFAGVDATLQFYPTTWLEIDAKAAIVRAKDLSNDAYLVYIPPDTYSANLIVKRQRFGPLHDIHWDQEIALTTQQTRVDLNADFAPPPPAYLLLNSTLTGLFFIGNTQWNGSLEVRNILNQRYRNYLSRQRYVTLEPGRSVIGRVALDF
jgi:iron complex outermembrane receptor protein